MSKARVGPINVYVEQSRYILITIPKERRLGSVTTRAK